MVPRWTFKLFFTVQGHVSIGATCAFFSKFNLREGHRFCFDNCFVDCFRFFLAIRTISIFLCRLRSPWWAPDRLYIILSLRADTNRNPLSLRIDYCWPQYLFQGHLKTPNRPVKASKSAKSQKHAERERTLITEAFGNDFTNPRLGWKTRIPRTKHQFPSPAVNWMFSKMADGYSICCTQRIVLYETKAVSIYKL